MPFLPGDHVLAPPGFGYVIVPPREALSEPHSEDDVFVAWKYGGHSWIARDLLTRKPNPGERIWLRSTR